MQDKLKNIKLIVIDIDGTLVDRKGSIGDETKKLADELKKYGILCTLSSARSFHYSKHVAVELGVEIPFITLDGALIISSDNKIIYRGTIRRKLIKKCIDAAVENYGKIAMADESNLYITKNNSLVKEYSRLSAPVKEVDDYMDLDNILEVLIYCEDKQSVHSIKKMLKFPYTIGTSIYVTKSPNHEYYLMTIKKKGSDKLDSLKRLVNHLKLSRKNIAVIGDWYNDMPLFDYGAFNFAVQNAIPELKRNADYVTQRTNEEDAVGEVLQLIYNYCCKVK